MIKHVFLFGLAEHQREQLQPACAAIEALSELEMVRGLELGVDFAKTRMSYDVAVTISFDKREDLAAYEAHPQHKQVSGLLRGICDRVAVVDYESPGS